jgi:Fe-S oxidoreductase
VIKRYIIKPARLQRHENTEEKVIQVALLTVLMCLALLHYGIVGFGYAAHGVASGLPPIGMAIANALTGANISSHTLDVVFRSLWWFNFFLLLCGVIYFPRSKHLHPLTSWFNLTFKNMGPKGAVKLMDLKATPIGVSRIQDFTWKQLLDGYACTWCGRCHVVCPAQASGKPLSPRELILGMKDHLIHEGPSLLKAGVVQTAVTEKTEGASQPAAEKVEGAGQEPAAAPHHGKQLIGDVISEDAIWACTTCRACQEVCPVSNEHIGDIIDMRRYLQMVATTEVGRDPLKNMRVRGNPWRGTMYARTDWAEGMDIKIVGEDNNIDVLFWVGCTEALEDRSLKVAQAVAKLMKQAGVNFGILGDEEVCCGDPARRLGAEHIFQMLAASNIQLLQSYNIKKVVTGCPHCFNTFKNEYPQLGGQFEVIHHSQFIADLIKEGKLKVTKSNQSIIAYQDPCYLGRYNDVYDAPRQALESIPGVKLVDMEKNRKDGFCCGGGGGRMWLEEKIGQRISEVRLGQGLETKAQVLATACPYCLQMFEDACKAKGVEETLKVKDIAELLAESIETTAEPKDTK